MKREGTRQNEMEQDETERDEKWNVTKQEKQGGKQ